MASLCGRLLTNVIRRQLIVAPAAYFPKRFSSTSKYCISFIEKKIQSEIRQGNGRIHSNVYWYSSYVIPFCNF